jgi:hypothetical protein
MALEAVFPGWSLYAVFGTCRDRLHGSTLDFQAKAGWTPPLTAIGISESTPFSFGPDVQGRCVEALEYKPCGGQRVGIIALSFQQWPRIITSSHKPTPIC